jgi:hypothetical protein
MIAVIVATAFDCLNTCHLRGVAEAPGQPKKGGKIILVVSGDTILVLLIV